MIFVYSFAWPPMIGQFFDSMIVASRGYNYPSGISELLETVKRG